MRRVVEYANGTVVRTLVKGIEGIIIDRVPYFTDTYITYIVELCYGETVRLGAQDFAVKNDPIHIKLDEARRVARERGYSNLYIAKDNITGEWVVIPLNSRKDFDSIAKAKGNLSFYRELAINSQVTDVKESVAPLRGNERSTKVIAIGRSVTKVRIQLYWEDAADIRHRYFDTVEELAVFLRLNPALAKAIGYVARQGQRS